MPERRLAYSVAIGTRRPGKGLGVMKGPGAGTSRRQGNIWRSGRREAICSSAKPSGGLVERTTRKQSGAERPFTTAGEKFKIEGKERGKGKLFSDKVKSGLLLQ